MSFNWSDIIVICTIAGFAIIGLFSGFILSVFRLTSYFIAIIISVKYYPVVADFLMGTELYNKIKNAITENIKNIPALDAAKIEAASGSQINNTVGSLMESLKLPDFLKSPLVTGITEHLSKGFSNIIEGLGGGLAQVIVSIIGLVLLFIAVRFGLTLLKFLLSGIAKLPVFKQVDKIGGLAFGAVEGFLMIYVILAILMIFQASPSFEWIFTAIDNSIIAKYLYHNNFIVNWMFS